MHPIYVLAIWRLHFVTYLVIEQKTVGIVLDTCLLRSVHGKVVSFGKASGLDDQTNRDVHGLTVYGDVGGLAVRGDIRRLHHRFLETTEARKGGSWKRRRSVHGKVVSFGKANGLDDQTKMAQQDQEPVARGGGGPQHVGVVRWV